MISEDFFAMLKPGDSVLIVNEWDEEGLSKENENGEMDHWLGKSMTVRDSIDTYYEPYVQMIEDQEEGVFGGGWFWNRFCIEKILNKEPAIGIEELI